MFCSAVRRLAQLGVHKHTLLTGIVKQLRVLKANYRLLSCLPQWVVLRTKVEDGRDAVAPGRKERTWRDRNYNCVWLSCGDGSDQIRLIKCKRGTVSSFVRGLPDNNNGNLGSLCQGNRTIWIGSTVVSQWPVACRWLRSAACS